MSEAEIPEEILRKHPELETVGQALAQHRRGEPVTVVCPKCGVALHVVEVAVTNVTSVVCLNGHTLYRSKHATPDTGDAPVVVSADEAMQHGLVGVTVRCDVAAAGMYARPFPAKNVIVALNGPPGGPLAVMVWDCTSLNVDDLEAVVRARLNEPGALPIEVSGPDEGHVLGEEQSGLSFRTGTGRMRMAWFAFVARRPGGTVLVGLGTSGHLDPPARAASILANTAIAAAVRTLSID